MMKFPTFLILVLLVFCSCEKVLFEEDQASVHPFDNFDYLWTECEEKYAYFELKDVDWEAVRAEYRARLFEGMSEDSLFNVLGEMLSTLRDDHANLFSNFKTSFFGVEYLGQDNFDWRIIVDHYLTPDYSLTGPFQHGFLADQRIGYLRLATFPGTIDADHLDFLLTRYQATEGLIIDLRENGGGAIADVYTLLSRFVETETLVQYTRIKSGPGPQAFSEPEPVFVQAYNGIRYTNPVAILTDRGTFSSGSLFALATKALPNVLLVGDTTGGGLGLPNGGQLPNGWRYRFSVTQTLDLDQKPDFENGVPPDVPVLFDWNDLLRDEVLERAILELL